MTVPLPHLACIALVAIGYSLVRATPLGRRRRWLAAVAGVAAAAVAAALGWVPWLGEYRLTAYGLFLLLAFAAAYLVAVPRAAARGVREGEVAGLTLVALLAGIAGARARYVWENRPAFTHDAQGEPRPWPEVLAAAADFDGGGMVMYGGLILAAIAVALAAWRRRLPVLPLADAVAPAVLAGLALGRLGCWFNGCCYGAACDLPWAVRVPGQAQPVHPTQLYEALAASVLAIALVAWDRRPRAAGLVAGAACIGYGAWRFANEALRGDHHAGARTVLPGLGEVSNSQATSLLVVAIGLGLVGWAWRRTAGPASTGPS